MITILQRFQKLEKRILAIALLCALLFSYFLYDDSFFDFENSGEDLHTVGSISNRTNDVRQKISKQYHWKNAKLNSEVHTGDSLFTGGNSTSTVTLNDGTEIQLRENSLVIFNIDDNQMGLDFRFGRIMGGSSKLKLKDCGQLYEVSGEGAEFQIDNDGGCSGMKVKVLSGKVDVNGKKFEHPEVAILKKGQAPAPYKEPPKATLAPRIVEPQNNYAHMLSYNEDKQLVSPKNFKMRWTYTKTKAIYEFEIASDPDFTKLVARKYPQTTSVDSPNLPKGNYYLRIHEYVANSKSPMPWSKTLHFTVEEKSLAPKLEAPELLTKNIEYNAPSAELPQFQWGAVSGASQYVLQISRDSEFTKKIDVPMQQLQYKWNKFNRGNYYIRVFASTPKGTLSPPSEVGTVHIDIRKPILEPVPPHVVQGKTPEDPGDPQEIKVKWTDLSIADTYQIQVSEDDSFSKPLQFESRSPAGTVTVPKPGNYKWRVRPLASNGKPLTAFSDQGIIQYQLKVPLSTPVLLEPAQNMTLFFQKDIPPVFWLEWQAVRQAEIYVLEISSAKDFSTTIISQKIKTSRFLINEKLPQGKLYWRVRAEGDGKTSEWSEARRMSIYAGKSARVHAKDLED